MNIEGYLAGEGQLVITHAVGTESVFMVDPSSEVFCFSVEVGEYMQWLATGNSRLQVFEVCFPPYQDGRFENVPF